MPKLEYDRAKTMALICERMSNGQSVRSICREEGMPGKTSIMRWLDEDEGGALRDQYARAREALADAYAEQIIEIADEAVAEDAQVARLRVDVRKWAASKIAPRRYGDKTELELGGKGPQGEITTLLVTGVVRAGD